MSDATLKPALPPLFLHPERKERKETWLFRVETTLKPGTRRMTRRFSAAGPIAERGPLTG